MTFRFFKALHALARPLPRPSTIPAWPQVYAPSIYTSLVGTLHELPAKQSEQQRLAFIQTYERETAKKLARRKPRYPALFTPVASLSPINPSVSFVPWSEEQVQAALEYYNTELEAHLKQKAEDAKEKAARKRYRRRVLTLLLKPFRGSETVSDLPPRRK